VAFPLARHVAPRDPAKLAMDEGRQAGERLLVPAPPGDEKLGDVLHASFRTHFPPSRARAGIVSARENAMDRLAALVLAILVASPAAAAPKHARRRAPASSEGRMLGTLEMPRLGISVPVREGVKESTLSRAVGHVPGTALPNEPGNVGLAGHRTSHFGPLRDVTNGDEIRLVTKEGSYVYEVASTEIVDPSAVHVLRTDGHAMLTLVTCFPFEWKGHAPKRFIVRAHLMESPFAGAPPASVGSR
jgi:LPXTG-site transpeptidase (sortase) family protein